MTDFIGLLGVALVLAAYFFLQTGRLHFLDRRYLILNIIGSLAILFSLIFDFNLASFVIEASWVVISVYGLVVSRSTQSTDTKK